MSTSNTRLSPVLKIVTATLSALAMEITLASTILQIKPIEQPGLSTDSLRAIIANPTFEIGSPDFMAAQQLNNAVARGQWAAACGHAATILANQEPNTVALGIFTLCAAIRNQRSVVEPALDRLLESEPEPHYYNHLVRAVLHLMDKAPEKALDALKPITQPDPGKPLARYFAGEALHALGKDAEAIRSFEASLATWPEHAPALAAIARLSARTDSSRETLEKAIAMTEQATRIETSNLGYWKQLADLCERNGETGRASAIRLQWLRPRLPH